MKEGDQVEAFLREGVARYVRAHETLSAFEREMEARLQRYLENAEWTTFKPATGASPKTVTSGNPRGERWIAAWIVGVAADRSATLGIGLCWNPPRAAKAARIAYANFSDTEDEAVINFTRRSDARFERIQWARWSGASRLYIPLGTEPGSIDLDRDFRELIAALQFQVSTPRAENV